MFNRKKKVQPKEQPPTPKADPLEAAAQRAIDRGELISRLRREAAQLRTFAGACEAGAYMKAELSPKSGVAGNGGLVYCISGNYGIPLEMRLDEFTADAMKTFANSMAALKDERVKAILGDTA